jgi:hypothetical protein
VFIPPSDFRGLTTSLSSAVSQTVHHSVGQRRSNVGELNSETGPDVGAIAAKVSEKFGTNRRPGANCVLAAASPGSEKLSPAFHACSGLLADTPVNALAEQVGVPVMTRVLLDHVHEQLAQ